jgi:hypothetical protein
MYQLHGDQVLILSINQIYTCVSLQTHVFSLLNNAEYAPPLKLHETLAGISDAVAF